MYKMKINIELNNNGKNQLESIYTGNLFMLNYIYLKKQFKLIEEQKNQNNLIIISIVFWN